MKQKTISLKLEKTFTDITEILNGLVRDMQEGLVTISTMHTTCGLKIMEDEILSLHDVDEFLRHLIPCDVDYAHDKINLRQVPLNERINGCSHIRMLFFDSSITIPITKGKLALGKWQTLFAVEMDGTPPRERTFILTITGE